MKELKDFINESIWDVEDNINSNNGEFQVWAFINENYELTPNSSKDLKISFKNKKYVVDFRGSVEVKNHDIEYLTNNLFIWGDILDEFKCNKCKNLRTLIGAPKYVGSEFNCSECDKLETLEGAPKIVEGDFYCNKCEKLKSLKGAPKQSVLHFDCSGTGIYSLEYAPKYTMAFYCSDCENLSDISWIAKKNGKIEGYFDCSNNQNLYDIKDLPEMEDASINLSNCINLRSLEGFPFHIGSVNLYNCTNLRDLKGISPEIQFTLNLSECTNLENIDDMNLHEETEIYIGNCDKLVLNGEKLTKLSKSKLKSLCTNNFYTVEFINTSIEKI